MGRKPQKKKHYICLCNGIDQQTIAAAIKNGASSLDEIFDATQAGVGACGGSCRPYIKQMLDGYLVSGDFPTIQRPKRNK